MNYRRPGGARRRTASSSAGAAFVIASNSPLGVDNKEQMGLRSFYSLSESERIALTHEAIEQRRTVLGRWTALTQHEAEGWTTRAALAGQWLAGQPRVLDLGCGVMTLERHLTDGTAYYPSDVTLRDERTLVADYNLQPPPLTDATAAACLGVLEYLHAPQAFMRALADHYDCCVVSYCITDAPNPLEPRRSHAWVNDFDRRGIENLFRSAGWSIDRFQLVDDTQGLWRLGNTSGCLPALTNEA